MFTIGICGGTSSGKTTLTNLLTDFFQNEITVISQDAYYKSTDTLSKTERENINFDHPDAIDFDLLHQHIQQLQQNKKIEQPEYSFIEHNRLQKTTTVSPKKTVIVEGILLFNDKRLLDLFDCKVFVDADETTRINRRIMRDSAERGRSKAEVLFRFNQHIKPMHDRFVAPTKNLADFIIKNNGNKNEIEITELVKIIQPRIK